MAAKTPVTFSGASSAECENFLAAVHQTAIAQGTWSSDRWITFYAASLLRGDALMFYESLDTKTKTSWADIRTAFVTRYVGTLPNPSNSTPTPAASPPAGTKPSLGQKGRIAVLRDQGPQLYLSSQLDSDTEHGLKMCESPSSAQTVFFVTMGLSAGPFELRAGDTSSHASLEVHWPRLDGDRWLDDKNYYACIITPEHKGPGSAQSKVWTLSENNSIRVQFNHSGGSQYLEPVENGSRLHLVQNASLHCGKGQGTNYCKARLAFEPI